MHVVGATNVGKSFFLEGIIKQLIVQGHGICLLDPHGDLYHRLLRFCAYLNTVQPELNLAQRVIPFDVADTANILGFNPVARNARVMTYQVVALMESIRKCWGQASFEATPRLARWLFNTAYAVIDSKLTFLQTQHMVDPTPNPYRSAITRRITNPRIKAEVFRSLAGTGGRNRLAGDRNLFRHRLRPALLDRPARGSGVPVVRARSRPPV